MGEGLLLTRKGSNPDYPHRKVADRPAAERAIATLRGVLIRRRELEPAEISESCVTASLAKDCDVVLT